MQELHDYLLSRPLLFDGGMGTYYKGKSGVECELANIADPTGIEWVHREYLAAGAMAIKTNTFGLPRMVAQGMENWKELLAAGWNLAVEAAEEKAYVFADIGAIPAEATEQADEIYTEIAREFIRQGATCFLFETLSGTEGIVSTIEEIRRQVKNAYIIVSFAVQPDGYTREGVYFKELFKTTHQKGLADTVGLNCVSAPGAMAKLLEAGLEGSVSLSAMPNAGYPIVTRNRVLYRGQPEYFAQAVSEMAQKGVSVVGGCCGTTPAHIAALRVALDAVPVEKWKKAAAPQLSPAEPTAPKAKEGDAFLDKLAEGKKVIAVELDPPKTADLTKYMEGARRLQAAGVDAMTVADCPIAHARMDSSLVACKVKRELCLTALPHMTCRDRNLNATKALLLGLYAEGVREVLAITGDPIPTAERDEVKSVYQFNSRKLAQYIRSLEGKDIEGGMAVFGALNLNAANFAVELRRAVEKVDNGMVGFLTQPVLSASALENLKLAHQTLNGRAKILVGIIPVVSQKNAVFMENEVNGIHVDAEIIAMYEGKDREQGEALALELSAKIARDVAPYSDGFYLMTPFNRVALMEHLVAKIREELL